MGYHRTSSPRRFLRLAALATAVLLPAPRPARADTTLGVGQTLTHQVFQWVSTYTSRADGTYGEYQIGLTAGQTYSIYTSSPSGGSRDTYLYLFNPSLTEVAEDDDSAGNYLAKITYTAPATGTYYVRLRAYAQGASGFCNLTASAQAASPPPSSTATVAAGSVLSGRPFAWQSAYANRWDGNYDTYAIRMSTGMTYTLKTSNASGGTTDTFLYLMNSDGTVAAQNDNGNGNLASLIEFPPPAAGTYYIRLRAAPIGGSGTCTLSVSAAAYRAGTQQPPDFIVWKSSSSSSPSMYDARITQSGGRKLLTFTNVTVNVGPGPLELFGVLRPDGTELAYQRVYNSDKTFTDVGIATFTFPPSAGYDSLHFNEFLDYNLRQVTSGGGVGSPVATAQKTVYGLADDVAYNKSLPGAPPFGVYANVNMGISTGWGDIYEANTRGQFIDVTTVADGIYWLESVSDPKAVMRKAGAANNVSRLKVGLSGTTLTILADDSGAGGGGGGGGSTGTAAGATLFYQPFGVPDGLITNEYAYYNPGDPASVQSSTWLVTSGSLFASGSQGWTGTPDGANPNATSSNGTDSATFRLLTRRSDFGDVAVTFSLSNQGLVSTTKTPSEAWDGVGIVLRYQSANSQYRLAVNRRDNTTVIQKVVPSGTSRAYYTLASAAHAVPYGTVQQVGASAQNNADGSVSLGLTVGGAAVASAIDAGTGGAAIRAAGKVGLSGDNDNFKFDDFTVKALGGAAPAAAVPPAQAPAAEPRAFPNPWRADRHAGLPLKFDSILPGATIKIYTLSGRFVRALGAPTGTAAWDLTDGAGVPVASGYYFYLVLEPDGGRSRGKLVVIR